MVHVVIIAHSELANSYLHCVEQIFLKKINFLHVIGVSSSDDANSILCKIQALIEGFGINNAENNSDYYSAKSLQKSDEANHEVLILTDIFGATPHNIASKLIIKHRIELITGLNLPMLIRAVSYADSGLTICTQKALDGGISGIIHINDVSDVNNVDDIGGNK